MMTENKPDKYFLCYGFPNFSEKNLKEFHMTLIYFGVLEQKEVSEVKAIVEAFIRNDHLTFLYTQPIKFENVEMFGMNKDIRVLTPDKSNHVVKILMNDSNELIDKVRKYRKHNDFPFNPHVTTHLEYFVGNMYRLYLCKNKYEVVKSWSLHGGME